jgi:hypothetical protein
MQTTTPKSNNVAPITGRMVNEENEIVNVVDNFGSLKTIDVLNSTVHAGISFTYSGVASIPSAGHAYFHGKTGDITSHLMGFFVKADSAPITVEFFEAPTITANGTPQNAVARNRQSSTPPLMQVFANPTVTADGELLLIGKLLGNQHTVSSSNLEGEWILKKNTSYTFKITNNSNQTANIGAGFNWIEEN